MVNEMKGKGFVVLMLETPLVAQASNMHGDGVSTGACTVPNAITRLHKGPTSFMFGQPLSSQNSI